MDLDAALARQLQAEEQLQAGQAVSQLQQGQGQGSTAPQQRAFASRLQSCVQHTALVRCLAPKNTADAVNVLSLQLSEQSVVQFEDELLQALAQSVMPMDRLCDSAEKAAALSASLQEHPARQSEDLLAQELLSWFKHDFFTWVNSPACSHCGSQDMHCTGAAQPSAEEVQSGAGRVEVHTCSACNRTTRFPRYNDPAKLLETRSGRCGEWANCFTLCCRAAGLEARYIMDWTDHVWTEYYSQAHQRWIHLDPCEAAYDTPLLYEAGWGKQLNYVVAFSRHGVTDVIKRYTRQCDQVKQRRSLVTEEWLSQQCTHLTNHARRQLSSASAKYWSCQPLCQAALPSTWFTHGLASLLRHENAAVQSGVFCREWSPEEQAVWRERDGQEQAELAGHANAPTAVQDLHLPGRQTGSEGWKAARGELGAAPGASPAASSSTSFQLAGDEGLNETHPGRLCGGVVRASGQHQPHQTAVRAFDGGLQHKWLDFGGANKGVTWLEYRLLPSQPAVAVLRYSLTSAEDEPNRDPRDFLLEGSVECPTSSGGASWRVLDTQLGVMFAERHHTCSFSLQTSLPCRAYRLRVTAVRDPASANSVQLARLDLYVPLDPPPTQPTSSLLGSVYELQAAARLAAEAGPGSAVSQSVSTLLRVLCNIVQHPSESKHTTLRMENAKIKAMLSGHTEILRLLRTIGFRDSHLARQGKQPPEATLTLDMSEITEQAIMHTLTLLQSPMPADLIQQSTAFPAVKSRIKQTDLSQSQQPKIQLANSSNSAPADQAVTSNPAGQRGPSISAQPTLEHVVLDSTEQQISADALSSQAMLLASPDVQATTDASDSPMQSAAVSGATEAGGARDTTESNAAQASSQPVPETPGLLNMKAGTAQSSQDRSHQTPAYAQPAPQTVPDAPQRQTKAPVPQNALAGFHKLQLQAPAAADTQASGMPALTAGAKGLKAAAGNAGSPCQKDLKSLIHHEFARLMATGTYTPNEAAVLAIQIVSHQH